MTTTRTHFRNAIVNGRKIFYREAGDPSAPTILLLHGLPTSSQMFRDLMSLLSGRFHLVAPDYVGFGHSDAPSRDAFSYSFDNLAFHVAGRFLYPLHAGLWRARRFPDSPGPSGTGRGPHRPERRGA